MNSWIDNYHDSQIHDIFAKEQEILESRDRFSTLTGLQCIQRSMLLRQVHYSVNH